MTVVPSPVLVLTNQLRTGGAEHYVLTVVRWLADHGVRVVLAATPGELVDDVDPRVTYVPIALDDLRADLPLAAWRVRSLVRTFRPRAVLANSLATAVAARLAAPRTGLVTVAHGWTRERHRAAPFLAVADRVVAVSDDVGRALVDAGLPARKVRVIPNGVELERFGPRPPEARAAARAVLGAGPDDVVVINVGRLAAVKAQHRVVTLAERTRDVPGLRFAVVGAGPEEAALRSRIAAGGVGDRVTLTGLRRDVADLLLAADVYLSTALSEGMSLSALEGLAAGLPMVVTEAPGMSVLVDDANGVRVDGDDPAALEAAVRRLAADAALRRRLGDASRDRAEASFSFDTTCRRLAELLGEVA